MSTWTAVLAASAIAYLTKLAGYLVPAARFEHPYVRRALALLPTAMLAALVVVQTVATRDRLVLDARGPAVLAAAVALTLRAPFLVVVVTGAVVAAGLRALGWG